MVWKEYMDEVIVGLGATSPIPGLTRGAVLRALTEARHELQMETGLCHKRMDMDLSAKMDTTTGIIDDGGLVNEIDRAELIYQESNSAVGVVDPEAFEQFVRQGQLLYPANRWSPDACPVAVITTSDDGLQLYPFLGFTAYTLRLRYQPRLKPYAKSETEQYPNFATDFNNQIQANGPEPVFDTGGGQRGMIARAKMLLFTRIPDIDRALSSQYPIWAGEWENAKNLVEKNNPSMSMTSNPMPYFVPVP